VASSSVHCATLTSGRRKRFSDGFVSAWSAISGRERFQPRLDTSRFISSRFFPGGVRWLGVSKGIAVKRGWRNHLGERPFTPAFLNFQGRLTRGVRRAPYRFSGTPARITVSSSLPPGDHFYLRIKRDNYIGTTHQRLSVRAGHLVSQRTPFTSHVSQSLTVEMNFLSCSKLARKSWDGGT
jgi:hypothetical protein